MTDQCYALAQQRNGAHLALVLRAWSQKRKVLVPKDALDLI